MCEIKKVASEEKLIECSAIRKKVFGDEEQAVESLYRIDEFDRMPETRNFLLSVHGETVGTARYLKYDDSTAKLQRMAIVKNYRGQGLASKLLNTIESVLVEEGYKTLLFDAASSAKIFYEKNGYQVISDEFYEDGRPHLTMKKDLTAN